MKGKIVECPKHNGRFHLTDGSPARSPVCRGLATFPLEERAGRLYLNIARPGGAGARDSKTFRFRVVSNRSVATFIKELVLEPLNADERISFMPGDYLQLDIPAYHEIHFREFDIPEPYACVWRAQHVFDLVARNPVAGRRNNYSIASNPTIERTLRFNVRIATPPPGQDCPPGVGSAYVFNLRPGDTVTAIGPFGDFHLKPTQKEVIYIGGGAGMAPLLVRRFFTTSISPDFPAPIRTSRFISHSPPPCQKTNGTDSPALFTRSSWKIISARTQTPGLSNTTFAGHP